jgi:hypothetical protein
MTTKEKIILGIAGIIVIAGVALAATGVLTTSASPEAVFKKMSEAKAAVTSSHLAATVTADVSVDDAPKGHVAFNLNGVATNEKDNSAADLHFSVSGSQAGSGELTVQGDMRVLNKIVYFRPTQIPPVIFIDPSMVMNKWFSIDPIALYKDFGNSEQAAQFEDAFSAKSKMPAEFYEKSYALGMTTGFITGMKSKGNEVVSGVATQKFEITADVEKIPDFLAGYTALYNTYAKQVGVKELTPKKLTDEDREVFKGMKLSPLYVWVGKADYLPYKMSGTMTIVTPKMAASDSSTTAVISFEAVFSDYNKAVTVETPTDATPIQNLIQSLMGGK